MSVGASNQKLAPYLEAQKSSRTAALLIFTLLLGPPTLLLGAVLYGIARTVERPRVWIALLLAMALGLLYAGWHWRAIAADGMALYESGRPLYQALQGAFRQSRGQQSPATPVAWLPLLLMIARRIWDVWRWGLLGVPLVALYLHGTRLKTAEEQERQRVLQKEQALQARSAAAAKASRAAPLELQGQLVLGSPVEGDLPWTRKQWVVYPPDGHELDGLQKDQVAATYNRYRAFFRALRGSLDGDWSWEDVAGGYFLLDGLALKDQAVSLGRYLLEDFAHYVSARKDKTRRVLLIVDEFSALAIGGTDAASLFERVRSCGASVMVTSQSYAGLGAGADRILGAAAAVLLHQCPDPEVLIARAGMERERQQRVVGTERFGLGGVKTYATGQVSFQEREAAKVRPESVQQLEAGECVLIVGGQFRRVRVSRVVLPESHLAVARRAMQGQPRRLNRPAASHSASAAEAPQASSPEEPTQSPSTPASTSSPHEDG